MLDGFEYGVDRREPLGQQLWSLMTALESRLKTLSAERAVIRTADYNARQRVTAGVQRRLQVEGIALAVTQRAVGSAEALSGREVGARCGSDKASVEARAGGLGVEDVFIEAASAALGALGAELASGRYGPMT